VTRARSFLRPCLAAVLVAITAMLAVAFPARAQPFAYYGSGSVPSLLSVIDLNSSTATSTRQFSNCNGSAKKVVIGPGGNRIYIGHDSGVISVVDATTNAPLKYITPLSNCGGPFDPAPVSNGGPVVEMAIDDTGQRLYAIVNGTPGARLVVLDIAAGTVLANYDIAGLDPVALAFNPANHRLYVAQAVSGGSVGVFDVSNPALPVYQGPIAVDGFATGIAVSPSGDRVYVATFGSPGKLSVIDAATNTVTATTPGTNTDGNFFLAVNTTASSGSFGHVFMIGEGSADIDEFKPDGSGMRVFGAITSAPGNSSLFGSMGISVASDGLSLFIMNNDNLAIERFPIPNASPTTNGTLIPLDLFPHSFTPVIPTTFGDFVGPNAPRYTPFPPQIIDAVSNRSGQATVSFNPPDPTPGGASDPAVGTYTYTVVPLVTPFDPLIPAPTATGSGSPITVNGLANGSTYTFTVFATSANGDGVPSVPSDPVTPQTTVADAPTGVSAVAGIGQATISFTPPAYDGGLAITSYTVTSSPGAHAGTGAGSPITVTGLTRGTHYTFTVTAHNSRGDSVASSPSNEAVPYDVPGAPTLTGVTGGNHQASVTFAPPGDTGGLPITSYTVTSSPGGITATGTSSPILVTGLTNLTPYTFTVTATNAGGTGVASNASTPVVLFQPPAAPTAVSASVFSTGVIRVDCAASSSAGDAPGGIASYTVSSSPGGFTSTTPLGCPYFIAGLTIGTSYTFTVVANTSLGPGAVSAPSNAVVAATTPGAPTSVTAGANGQTSASISFTSPASNGGAAITGYTIRSTPSTGLSTDTTSSPAVFSGLTPGVSYTFAVTARNAAGEGPQSAASNAVVTVVDPPANVHALGGDASATLTFVPPAAPLPSPVTSYSATSSPGGITVSGTSRPVIHVTGLTNGTPYTFTVTTHHANGSSETSTASNSVTPAKLPARTSPWAYVPSEDDGLVSVIDTSTDRVINAIDLGDGSLPTGAAVNSAGTRVYIAMAGGVKVIDPATQAVIATIPVPDNPSRVAVDPSGAHVYTANFEARSMSVIDASTNAVTDTIPLPNRPADLDVDPAGASVYVSLPDLQEIVRIDSASKIVAATSGPLQISGPIFAAPGGVLYAAAVEDLATLTASTLAPQSTTAACFGLRVVLAVAVDPATGHAFFTCGPKNFDPAGTVGQLGGGSVGAGTIPASISITPAGGKVYVTNTDDGTVSVVDAASMTVTATIPVGRFPLSHGHFIAPAQSNPPRLGAISTRMRVLTGDNVLIGGFVIGGSTPKTVVVRARGPSLASSGITNFLANPQLQLVFGDGTVLANDDWQSAGNAADVVASAFAPSDARESAILVTLQPGPYTAIVSGSGGGTGVGLVEVFEVDHPENALAGISTRGEVLTGNDVMIGGIVIQGDSPQTVVVRARGPSLASQGVANPLSNPVLQLVSSDGTVLANDDWQSASNAAAIQASGFAPSDPRESAILVTLQPGAYTAIVSGAGGATGVGLVEVFAQ
jgi:YVTN family beta-propeller protein